MFWQNYKWIFNNVPVSPFPYNFCVPAWVPVSKKSRYNTKDLHESSNTDLVKLLPIEKNFNIMAAFQIFLLHCTGDWADDMQPKDFAERPMHISCQLHGMRKAAHWETSNLSSPTLTDTQPSDTQLFQNKKWRWAKNVHPTTALKS